jgi:hypothetical protein
MGASLVTTASADAINNISKLDEQKQQQAVNPHQHIKNFTNSAEIPPECPMHAEHKKTKPAAAECPITGEKGDMNMLNMVIMIVYY